MPVVLKGTLAGESIDEEAVCFGGAEHRVRERVCHMCAGVEGGYNTLSIATVDVGLGVGSMPACVVSV